MHPGSARVASGDLEAALWRLLASSDRQDDAFLTLVGETADAFAGTSDPLWVAWRSALAARRALLGNEPDQAAQDVAAARESLDKCDPSAHTALAMSYLAHIQVAADHFDSAMLLAVDASLLTEHPPPTADAGGPSRALLQAHRWLSMTLAALDLEELAVAHAMRAQHVAAALRSPEDQWRMRLLSAQQHTELAQTLRRRGNADRARELAGEAVACAASARELGWEPDEDATELDLLDVVQAWALTCADDLDGALGPLRRVRRRVEAEGSLWLRGYTGLALARLLARMSQRDGNDEESGEEAIGLLVDAGGAFAAAGDRRRYRQSLLELGQLSADLGRPAEALHWLEAYRADTGRAQARGRELWAEMFVRRSRLREAERQAALLRRHALEDPLTGLGNRRSAERRLGALPLSEQPLSLAVVDVDRFKSVNDAASHTEGDVVLRRVADLLREHSRTGDEVYRWAGDEFLVILPRATEPQAVVVAERLRSAVAAADWNDVQIPGPVTVSIGVASTAGTAEGTPGADAGWRALFDAADLHLFSAKRSGRNRVRAPGAGASTGPAGDPGDDEDAAPDGEANP
ncbi:GGDEF domain-containing protein [Blastococcus sp. CT_GayMR19]|uniref:GGDEF domain-containing protein n=1 Tax=Blastococcus sp. CT_GayMR19 TaxID=2559608 RepID=UPI00107327D7|nr:GGDEF domain-containing protein [Blastococcus sp. CT_GayMR19]TFV74964.1 GGDEF domain-containing protein [Blastococcus sp. CT_GayMR19]